MLSEYHAPTRLMVNMYYYLQNLGYEPVVFAGSKKNLHISNSMFCYANRFNNSGKYLTIIEYSSLIKSLSPKKSNSSIISLVVLKN